MEIFLIINMFLTSLLGLNLLWCILRIRELSEKERWFDYSLNVAFYNDFIQGLSHKDEVTPEEDFQVIRMQDDLQNQARTLGFEIPQFERPSGSD